MDDEVLDAKRAAAHQKVCHGDQARVVQALHGHVRCARWRWRCVCEKDKSRYGPQLTDCSPCWLSALDGPWMVAKYSHRAAVNTVGILLSIMRCCKLEWLGMETT
jgi:hypothetical protein